MTVAKRIGGGSKTSKLPANEPEHMRLVSKSVFVSLLVFIACQSRKEDSAHEQQAEPRTQTAAVDTIRKSIPKEEHARVGGTHFTVRYHAPAVRGRFIWGGLVPYDEVWVTGAHAATVLEFDRDITIGSAQVAAGKYGFFTIPGKEKWVLILNRNWDQHLTDEYDAKDDVLRIDVTPEILAEAQERLKYSIMDEGSGNAVMSVSWEKVKVSIPIRLE